MVKVAAGGAAGRAHVADQLAAGNALPGLTMTRAKWA